MKIIKDNVCFVDFKDLLYKKNKDSIDFDKDKYNENDFVVLTEEKDIDYAVNREDIIDYDIVKDLSNEELDILIKKIEKDLEPFYIQISKIPFEERSDYINNHESKQLFYTLDKVYYDLLHYRNNREKEDLRILDALNNALVRKTR